MMVPYLGQPGGNGNVHVRRPNKVMQPESDAKRPLRHTSPIIYIPIFFGCAGADNAIDFRL